MASNSNYFATSLRIITSSSGEYRRCLAACSVLSFLINDSRSLAPLHTGTNFGLVWKRLRWRKISRRSSKSALYPWLSYPMLASVRSTPAGFVTPSPCPSYFSALPPSTSEAGDLSSGCSNSYRILSMSPALVAYTLATTRPYWIASGVLVRLTTLHWTGLPGHHHGTPFATPNTV